jgi:hypothetical protein
MASVPIPRNSLPGLLVAPRTATVAEQGEECRLGRAGRPKILQEAPESCVEIGRLYGMFQTLIAIP